MERFNKNEKEILYNTILKIDTMTPVFPSPEEAAINLANIWDATFQESAKQKISENTAEGELVYAKLAAFRYYLLAIVIPQEKGEHYPLLFSLMTQISNTIVAVIKLADEGLDYQALSLIRNLMELYMMLLTAIESPEKRTELRQAVDAESARKVWHKYFNKKHFIQMIEIYTAYDIQIKEACKKWVEEIYAELSSFAHNDYVNMICFSRAIGENGIHPPNLWGEYVSRQGYVYQNLMKVIAPADSLLTAMMRDPKIDIGLREFFDDFKSPLLFELSLTHNLISDACLAIISDLSGNQKTREMIRKPLCDFERPKRTLKHKILARKLKGKKSMRK